MTGICSGILDPEHNILLAEGWQEICTDFHRVHPETCARCLESNRQITQGLGDQNNGIREIRCRNEIVFATCPDF